MMPVIAPKKTSAGWCPSNSFNFSLDSVFFMFGSFKVSINRLKSTKSLFKTSDDTLHAFAPLLHHA